MSRHDRRGPGCGARLFGLLLLLVLLAVGAEFGARWFLADRIENRASQRLEAPVDVTFGTSPVLPGLVTSRTLDSLHLSSPATAETPALEIDGAGARLDGDTVTLDSISGTATLTDAQLTEAATRGDRGSGAVAELTAIRSVRADVAEGVLRADVGGVAEIGATPGVSDGRLTFSPQQTEILGLPLPDGLFSGITTIVDGTMDDLPAGVTIDGARVVDGGLEVHLSGTGVTVG